MDINNSKLLNEIKLYTSYINNGDKCWENYQAIANAYLYLDNINDYLKNTNKAIELLFEHIETFSDDHFAKYDFLLLNCSYLWFSQNENYKQIAEKLKEHYIKEIENGNDSDNIYYRLAQVYFMLEEYEPCAELFTFLREGYNKVSLISRAITDNDSALLETVKSKIEKLSKKQYIGTGDSGVDIYIWYYYEVCLKHLGLPNKIDEIYNFKHSIKNDNMMINKKLLNKIIIKSFEDLQQAETPRRKSRYYETLGKAYLYLDNIEQFYANTKKSIENLLLSIESRDKDDLYRIYNEKLMICISMWRIQDDITNISQEIIDYYLNKIEGYFDSSKEKVLIASMYFIQKNYQKAIEFFEQIDNPDIMPYAYPIAKAIVSDNMNELENIKDEIIKLYSKKLPIGTDTPRGFGVWDYYEICLKYLGLPNKIDEIYNFKHGIKNEVPVEKSCEDNSVKKWSVELIQPAEIYSKIYLNEHWSKIKELERAAETTDILLETDEFKNISKFTAKKTVEINTNDWQISAVTEEYSPSSDVMNNELTEIYMKNVNTKNKKISRIDTNHALEITHKIIIETTKSKAEQLCADLSDEYFNKYSELDEVIDEIKQKIPSDIKFIEYIPCTNFDTEYIDLLYVE